MSSIQFTTTVQRLEHLQGHYLEVSAELVQQLGGKLPIRLLCTLNHSLTFQCGLMALGQGRAYINLNNKKMKASGIQHSSQVNVTLEPDESEYGVEMPAELAELLSQDEEGNDRFNQLTPGKQRLIIQYVAAVKNPQLRVDRAILYIETLKCLPIGKESISTILRGGK